MLVYVLANSQQEFADWCVRESVHPAGVVCVVDPNTLRGKVRHCDRVIDARRDLLTPPVPPAQVLSLRQ